MARASLRSLLALGSSPLATVDRPGSSRLAVAWAPGILLPSPPSSSTRGTHRASSGGALDAGPRGSYAGVHIVRLPFRWLEAAAALTVFTERRQGGVPVPFLPRSRWLAGVSWRRSFSSATPLGVGRLVRDESGKFVRVVTGGDRGEGGTGKKRVRDSNNADGGGGDGGQGGGRGGGRGRGRGVGRGGGRGDARLITASICTAALPQDILSIVRDHHRELNYIHVSISWEIWQNRATFPRDTSRQTKTSKSS